MNILALFVAMSVDWLRLWLSPPQHGVAAPLPPGLIDAQIALASTSAQYRNGTVPQGLCLDILARTYPWDILREQGGRV